MCSIPALTSGDGRRRAVPDERAFSFKRRSQTAVNDRVSFEYFLKCERQRATELHASTAMCDTSDCDSCMVCDIAVCRVTSSTPRQQWSVWSVPSGQWSVREPSELMVTGTRTTSVITSPIYSNYIEKKLHTV